MTVVRNRANDNLGGSHESAFADAVAQGYTHVVLLHGDDQGHIRDLLPILERGGHRSYDACLGARLKRGSRLQGYLRCRIFGNYVFNALFSIASLRRIVDLGSGSGSVAVLLGLGVFAIRLAVPALSINTLIRFQAQTVIGAHALRLGDMLCPFDGRFFLFTRLGTILGVSGLQHLGMPTGLAAFRVIGIVSMVLLLGASLMLLWRVYRVGPAPGLLCCMLFPPIFESADLPNDNMPSAALAGRAMLLFWTGPTILLLTEVQGWGARAIRACIAGVIVVATPILVYRLCGLSRWICLHTAQNDYADG